MRSIPVFALRKRIFYVLAPVTPNSWGKWFEEMYHVYQGGTFLRMVGKIFPTTRSKNPEALVRNNLAVEISNVSRNVKQVKFCAAQPYSVHDLCSVQTAWDNCQSKDAMVSRVYLSRYSEVSLFGWSDEVLYSAVIFTVWKFLILCWPSQEFWIVNNVIFNAI
jgi:hypothetical protein